MKEDEIQKIIKNLDPDVMGYIFNKGYVSRGEHNQPSRQTLELIADLDKKSVQQFGLIQSIHETIHSEFGVMQILKEIKTQVTRTNGRVNKLESWQTGVVAVVVLLSFIVPTCVGWFFYKITSLSDQVLTHISSKQDAK
jgi:hypothetical protein